MAFLRILCPAFLACAAAQAQSFDLGDLPAYAPVAPVSGVVRNSGMDLKGNVKVWETGFARFQPGVRFEDRFPSTEMSVGALEWGLGDLAPSGREPTFTEWEGFDGLFGTDMLDLVVATGTYDLPGTYSPVLFVHTDNPLSKLTLRQADGIFGSERTGVLHKSKWIPKERGPEANVRTWDQLGLTGEWSGKAIQTYGVPFGGVVTFFQMKVLDGSDKWNPNLREIAGSGDLEALAKDRYGIAWNGLYLAKDIPKVKPLALAQADGGPYVAPTLQTVRDRSYPLTRSLFIFANQSAKHPLPPQAKEFLLYVLSRQGQEDVVRAHQYLPLTAAAIAEQRKRLE